MAVNKNKNKRAPHKAILLLSIIKLIETGNIISPFIKLNDCLIDNFNSVWEEYVPTNSGYKPRITYPFYHLSSSPFWYLIKNSSFQGQSEYSSIKSFQRDYSGAIIDVGLFKLLKDPVSREEIKSLLKAVYLH